MELEIPLLQTAVSAIGVLLQLFIAERSRRQLAKQSDDTLDVQRLVTHRATASFVADKRQKWIDELRADMAFHLALSQEMIWKWDAIRSRTALKVAQEAKNPAETDRILQEAADAFAKENGARDREHQERHIRIKFRLNPKEALHIELRFCMEEIRAVLEGSQSAKNEAAAKILVQKMKSLIDKSAELAEQVLKAEWNRVKQEVAYPDALIATIPDPNKK
jgi:hypothetical protein